MFLAGSGELLEYNKIKAGELAKNNKIIFTGQCSSVPSFLNNLDCFVYSSRQESFGIAVLEAMYVGVPVIVSNNGPFIEITNNGKYATLFECENSVDLENKIENYLIDNTGNYMLVPKAQKYVIENFSIEKNFNQTINLYSQIINK